MKRTYQIRGSWQQDALVQSNANIEITRRRMVPGVGRDAGVGEVDVGGDEVARVELGNGFVLWTRVDDLIRERGRRTVRRDGGEAWEIDFRGPSRSGRGGAGGERGWLGLGIKVLEFFGVDLKQTAAKALCAAAERKQLHGNAPGLYRCSLDDTFSLTPLAEAESLPVDDAPILIFLHGTGSSSLGSFGELWGKPEGAAARLKLKARYGDRVYALEHYSLTQSPIQNALDVVERLPAKARIDLVSHSRGGLVGELLCLGQRDKRDDPLRDDLLKDLFAADRTVARQLGLSPLHPDALKERDEAYADDLARLKQLIEQLDEKEIKVGRFVRAACPARGTTLASGRLDRWLSVLRYFDTVPLVDDALDFLLAVVKERTDPRTLPGLEAMMPGSALTRLLQHPTLVTTADLSVIAGDIEGDTLWGQIKLLAVDWFYDADHDLVVNTGSMYGGIRRPERGARFHFDRGAEVCHFNYFANKKSVGWLVDGLTRAEGSDGGFQPMQAARQEEPGWREAVRRSRASTLPQPLAVLIPGTMGSALKAGETPVWLEYWALFKGGLGKLEVDAPEVTPTDVLSKYYAPLLAFLARSHRVEIFPYDWRLSVRDAAAKLADKLEDWLPELERQQQPLHLVAHSMGGLVVRAMIADGGRGAALWRRIVNLPNSRFMMLGTPNLGSHEAVRWLTGYNPTQGNLSLLDIHHDTDQIVDIVNRFPGLLELLPFDAEGPDFGQQFLWRDLKRQLSARWHSADGGALLQARATWDLLRQAAPDPKHMVYVAGCQYATVVDYQVSDYEEDWLIGRKRLEFLATRQGDGTVTWRSGQLPGVSTWYVEDTAHDELCVKKRAFPGYLDLLMNGTTSHLSVAPPAYSRAAAGESELFPLPLTPPADDIPDQAALGSFGFGITRPFDAAAAGPGVPTIQISLRHGSLAYARHPVLVGHYLGDSIISAEKALDERLGGALSKRLELGIYPGRLGSHALFFDADGNAKSGGALVLGLGQVGELSPGLLAKGVRDAALDFALRVAFWPDDRFGAAGVRSAALSCLLVGSGAGGMSVRDSVEAILRGATAANKKLVEAKLEGRVVVDRIEFIELFEDVAFAAAEALDAVLRDGQLAMEAVWPAGVIEEGQGQFSRVRCDGDKEWWQRLEIVEDAGAGNLRFIATTDRARAEETLATGQLRLADGFIRQACQSPASDDEVARTLFEMLLPNRLKELAPKQTDLVLLVDTLSARYPWELLQDRWSDGERPPAIAAGLVRQLKTPSFRPHPAHAVEATAFVVGNPDLSSWPAFAELRGARAEAGEVANLLSGNDYKVLDCIDEKPDAILSGLHRQAWRILHLAGHGVHEFELDRDAVPRYSADCKPLPPRRISGMVIGDRTFLTPGDVEQMRWVPELVFINCCHLGETLDETTRNGQLGVLAANLAVQFIEMGVKAVVAAGWAVDDAAAKAFAISFYTHMLVAGEPFGEAVRAAREEIWARFPNVNTWGAYQCYGDPGYRLHGDGSADVGRVDKPYFAPTELVADLRNGTAEIRMQVKGKHDSEAELDAMRAGIANKLGRIPASSRADWLARGDVAEALGLAWGETRAWAEGIVWLEKALVATVGACTVRAVEQCANYRVRLAAERWLALTASGRQVTDADRQALVAEIERALGELNQLTQRALTPERLNLLGSACKRLAWVNNDPEKRLNALVDMAEHYRQAYELSRNADAYPFANRATAMVLALRIDPARGGDWQATLENECRRMIEQANGREGKADFWGGVAQADCELVLLLIRNDLDATAANAAAIDIAELYRAAARRGASPREYASVREHLDFVIEVVAGVPGNEKLSGALAVLRAAL